ERDHHRHVDPTPPVGTATATATATPTTPAAATATESATPTPTSPAGTSTATATVTQTPLPIVASIIIGSATGAAGSTVSIDVTLETTAQVAGTQNDITLNGPIRIPPNAQGKPSCHVNPDIDKNGTSFAFQPSGCTPGTDCTGVRALVLALDNVTPIPNNSVLYSCDIEIATDTSGTIPLPCSNPGAGDPDGNKLGTDCTNGTITVATGEGAVITIGTVTGAAGDFQSLDVTLNTGVDVGSTQNAINFPPQAAITAGSDGNPICAVNSAIDKTGTFVFQPAGCT